MDRRTILLIEAEPEVPIPPVYATWNPLDKGAGVALSNGNLTAAAATSTSAGGVRGTVSMTTGVWYWEITVNLATNASFVLQLGMTTTASPIDNQLGFDVAGESVCGIDLGGNFRYKNVANNGAGPPFSALIAGDVVSFRYDADLGQLQVSKNGGATITVLSDPTLSEKAWYPTVLITRTKQVTANFGQAAFTYYAAKGNGARTGIYLPIQYTPTRLYYASEMFNTPPTDPSRPSVMYDPRFPRGSDVDFEQTVSCWALSGNSKVSFGSIDLLNLDRGLDELPSYRWKGTTLTIYKGYEGDSFSAFQVWMRCRVADCTRDIETIRITMSDPVAELEDAIQKKLYQPNVGNSSIAGKPVPTVIGPVSICEGRLLSTGALTPLSRVYQFNYGPVVVDSVYDRGDILSPTIDWTYQQDGASIRLANSPDNPVVANLVGSDIRNVRLNTWNVWNDWTGWTWTGNVPNTWTKTGAETATRRIIASGSAGRFQGDGTGDVYISKGSLVADANLSLYYLEVNVASVTSGSVAVRAGTQVIRTLNQAGIYKILFYPAANSAPNLAVLASAGTVDVTITGVRMTYAPTARTFPEFLQHVGELISVPSWWSTTMDVESGCQQYRLGTYLFDAITARGVLQEAVDSICGWITSNRTGQVTFGNLYRTANLSAVALDTSNIAPNGVSVSTEKASGLTTRLAGQKIHRVHSDGEIAGSVDAFTGIRPATDPITRAMLTTEYNCIKEWSPATNGKGNRLTMTYSFAASAPYQVTLLQNANDIQREINRVCSMFALGDVKRYTVDCILDDSQADSISCGQKVLVTFPMSGLDSGKELLVIGVRVSFFSRAVRLTLLELTT